MKVFLSLVFLILSINHSLGADIIEEGALRALEAEFFSIERETLEEVEFREGFPGCDLIVSLEIYGELREGQGAKTYECDLCLLKGSPDFYDYDRDTIFCMAN